MDYSLYEFFFSVFLQNLQFFLHYSSSKPIPSQILQKHLFKHRCPQFEFSQTDTHYPTFIRTPGRNNLKVGTGLFNMCAPCGWLCARI